MPVFTNGLFDTYFGMPDCVLDLSRFSIRTQFRWLGSSPLLKRYFVKLIVNMIYLSENPELLGVNFTRYGYQLKRFVEGLVAIDKRS